MEIKITLLGGASEIGASCILVEACNRCLLIDCGVRFDPQAPLPNLDQLGGKKLDAILVTHAHSDHSGALPIVHSSFPAVPILMTPPTIDLVSILQRDALKLMDRAFAEEGELPLYQQAQVESMLKQIYPIHHLDKWTMGDLEIRFLPAAHIIGASMIHITTPRGRLLFSGDFSVAAQRTVPALDRCPFPVDLLVTEATYGARMHSDRNAAETSLISNIAEVVMAGGRVLIPCFAIGRAQEVLLIVKAALQQKRIPEIPVFVDGMVRYVCNIYTNHDRYVARSVIHANRSGHTFYNRHITPVTTAKDRQKVLQTSPCIIIASSGMLSGGPSAFYAANLAGNAQDAILITGYQDEESPGRALLQLAESKNQGTIKLNDNEVEVNCRFDTYNLSAHADRMQIFGLVAALNPKTTILVHGDTEAKQKLKSALSCKDIEVGWDGLTVVRSYGKTAYQTNRSDITIDKQRIQSLLGEEPGPFKVAVLAQAFFGHKLDQEALAVFATEVEATGLLKRDDNRRSTFKRVKDVASVDIDATAEEVKRENPKGKLNELCLKNKLEHPDKRLLKKEDGLYHCLLTIVIEGQQFASSTHIAASKIVAEQLAARDLLQIITPHIPQAKPDERPPLATERQQQSAPVDNKRPEINNYLQKGLLTTFQCRHLDSEGPAHAPLFTMQAEAALRDGTCVTGDIVRAGSKKETQTAATNSLFAKLQATPAFVEAIEQANRPPQRQTSPVPRKKRDTHREIAEVITLLRSYDQQYHSKLPYYHLKKLAHKLVRDDNFSEEWITDQLAQLREQWREEQIALAHQHGYYPFIHFTSDIYNAFLATYDSWVLQLMAEYLDDPHRIFPNWGAQFAATMQMIGEDDCRKHADHLYRFITNLPQWAQNFSARDDLQAAITAAKLKRLRQKRQSKNL